MKQAITTLLVTCVLMGCQKTSSTTSTTTQSTLKFVENGKQFEWDGSLADNTSHGAAIQGISTSGVVMYTLAGLDNVNGIHNSISFDITKKTLTVGSFSYTGINNAIGYTAECAFQGYSPGLGWNSKANDFANVAITNISNGYADGTFNASLSGGAIVISNGVFTHQKIMNP